MTKQTIRKRIETEMEANPSISPEAATQRLRDTYGMPWGDAIEIVRLANNALIRKEGGAHYRRFVGRYGSGR